MFEHRWHGGFVCLLLLALSGCGFQPLYGERPDGPQVRSEMARIEIGAIADRVGQQLQNHLLDRLNPRGQPKLPLYHLEVKLSERKTGLAVETDDTVSRINLALSAAFELQRKADKAALFKGTARVVAAYNITRSEYANLVSERDAKRRAARALADDVKTRLAVYFSQRKQ